jgi:hypothetical protein
MRKFIYTLVALASCAACVPAQNHAAGSSHGVSVVPPVSPEKVWADLMEGNQRFVSGRTKVRELVHR